MRRILAMAMIAGALAGCAAPPPPGPTAGQNAQPVVQPGGGDQVLAAIGTPFLIVAKVPVCILTLVVAAPAGAVSSITDPDNSLGHELRQGLSDGIAQNCGPPYIVSP